MSKACFFAHFLDPDGSRGAFSSDSGGSGSLKPRAPLVLMRFGDRPKSEGAQHKRRCVPTFVRGATAGHPAKPALRPRPHPLPQEASAANRQALPVPEHNPLVFHPLSYAAQKKPRPRRPPKHAGVSPMCPEYPVRRWRLKADSWLWKGQ
ncbi:hypothetical protein ANANG_G00277720 [Anguilla anguilla]|uniref:Uncharacterized protein n=1 Tax=Anguilla anguilla TaxID=7936 RepID=A0A9D3RKL5_ANGAN|nr:hypothetical protein ANANG_G00277720 [Anguilla anguilla]